MFTTANLGMTALRAMGLCTIRMDAFMKGSGKPANGLEKEFLHYRLGINSWGNLRMDF